MKNIEESIIEWTERGFLDFSTEIKNCALAYQTAVELFETKYLHLVGHPFEGVIFAVIRRVISKLGYYLPDYIKQIVEDFLQNCHQHMTQ